MTKITIEIPTKYLCDIGGYLYTAADRAAANDDNECAAILDHMLEIIEGAAIDA